MEGEGGKSRLVGRQSKCGKIFTVSASGRVKSSLYLPIFFW